MFVSFHPETFDSIFDIIMLYVEISLHWSLKPVLQRTEGGRRQMSGCSCVCGERRDTRLPAPKWWLPPSRTVMNKYINLPVQYKALKFSLKRNKPKVNVISTQFERPDWFNQYFSYSTGKFGFWLLFNYHAG